MSKVPFLEDGGNAYRLDDDGDLESAPILASGRVSEEWLYPDFGAVDAAECAYLKVIQQALQAQMLRQ